MSRIIFVVSSLVVVCTAGPPMGGYGGSGSSNRPYPLYGHCQIEPNAAKMDANQAVDGMMVNGWVDFMQTSNMETSIRISLSGLNPSSLHGFHIHEFGDLSDGCESAMSHYNPFNQMHGAPLDMIRHVGDLGNVMSDGGGNVNAKMTDHQVMLAGLYAVFGRTVVVHEKADDLGKGGDEESTKTGNAGTRLACCVIGTANGTSWERNPAAGVMADLLRKRNLERIWQN